MMMYHWCFGLCGNSTTVAVYSLELIKRLPTWNQPSINSWFVNVAATVTKPNINDSSTSTWNQPSINFWVVNVAATVTNPNINDSSTSTWNQHSINFWVVIVVETDTYQKINDTSTSTEGKPFINSPVLRASTKLKSLIDIQPK